MDMRGSFIAINQGDNMGMMQAFENFYFRRKIILELLIELGQVDRFDGHVGSMFLGGHASSAIHAAHRPEKVQTYGMNSLVYCCKAPPAYFIQAHVTANLDLGVAVACAPGRRGDVVVRSRHG